MRRRVVVTGAGCVTPVGSTTESVWQRLTEGRSGVGRLTLFDASSFPVRIAAEVRQWDLSHEGEDPRRWQHCPRQTRFAIGAGIQAVRSAGLMDTRIDPQRLGVYLGCGECFQDFTQFTQVLSESLDGDTYHPETFCDGALRVFNPDAEVELEPNMPAAHLAALFDAQGPNMNCIAACASSTQAIGEATELIRRGDAEIMLSGGSHSLICPFGLTGLQRLEALSKHNEDPPSAVRPFDRDRDGFVVGEGGAVLVLEELEHALARGAEIWGEVSGYASSQDAFRITDSHPEGRGAEACIRGALEDAQLGPESIGYINAHGTGTPLNDKQETLAVKSALGDEAYRIPISSTKSMMGHLTTACGAVEMAVCLLAIRDGVVPPTINYHVPDPDCDLDYVPNTARELSCRHVLSNNFGFGGQNAALVVSRYDERSPARISRRAA